MNRKNIFLWSLVTAVVLSLSLFAYSHFNKNTGQSSGYKISLKGVTFPPDTRIVALEINIVGGRLASIPEMPFGWFININSDASSETSAKGGISVGAAAISKEDVEKIFVIDKMWDSTEVPKVDLVLYSEVYSMAGSDSTTKHVYKNVALTKTDSL